VIKETDLCEHTCSVAVELIAKHVDLVLVVDNTC